MFNIVSAETLLAIALKKNDEEIILIKLSSIANKNTTGGLFFESSIKDFLDAIDRYPSFFTGTEKGVKRTDKSEHLYNSQYFDKAFTSDISNEAKNRLYAINFKE